MDTNTCSNSLRMTENGDMSSYKKSAINVVFFKIVYEEDDTASKSDQFKPVMARQIFGKSESIFGYRTLAINLYYLHNSSRCYVDIQKSNEVTNTDIYKPDDIMKSLEPWLPNEFTTDKSEFEKMVKVEEHDVIFGTVLAEFKDKKKGRLFCNKEIEVNYKVTKCDASDERFRTFHERFETFIVWYIDGANKIDLENDKNWTIFYVYEEFEHPITKEMYRSPIGYCSVYKFYAYPDKIRIRISQFFILPPHQRKGIGSQLYKTVVENIKTIPELIDITVEEPTMYFQKIRDFYDCNTIYKELHDANISIDSSNTTKILDLMREHKICRKQSQRIFDILNCYEQSKATTSDCQNEYFTKIKKRIASDTQREYTGRKRLCSLDGRIIVKDPGNKQAQIESQYKKYVKDIEPSVNQMVQHFHSDE